MKILHITTLIVACMLWTSCSGGDKSNPELPTPPPQVPEDNGYRFMYKNSGVFAGWTEIESQKVKPINPLDDRNTECTTKGYDDNTSVMCKGVYGKHDKYYNPNLDEGATGRHHSEVALANVAGEGDQMWASFAIYVDGTQNNIARIVAQWMDPNGWKPQFMLVLGAVKNSDDAMTANIKGILPLLVNHYLKGFKMREWVVLTYKVKFSTKASGIDTGYIDFYVNGVKVPNIPGVSTSEHTYVGATMAQAMVGRKMRFQGGGYGYWEGTATPMVDTFTNYLDNVVIADGSAKLEDVLPKTLPAPLNLSWNK